MNWWGKIIGGAFGFMLGGPLGALLGAALGHNFDKGMEGVASGQRGWHSQDRIQTAFFTATFAIMGRLCKADGRVSEDEITLARRVMNQMNLSAPQIRAAMALFKEGKKPDFPVDEVLRQLDQEVGHQMNLRRMFIEIQLYAAYADGVMHPSERKILLHICTRLGIDEQEFRDMAAAIAGEIHHQRTRFTGRDTGPSLKDAYTILNVSRNASDAEVTKAYRRLMNRHHPDKLVAKGLPEEMMKIAENRTHEIRQAYLTIKKARGF